MPTAGEVLKGQAVALREFLWEHERDFDDALDGWERMTPKLFVSIVVAHYMRRPQLHGLPFTSIMAASLEVGQAHLRPDGEEAVLVWDEDDGGATVCDFIVGYRGYVRLILRAGGGERYEIVEAHPVYTIDDFQYSLGLDPVLRHVPGPSDRQGELKASYAIVRLRGSERVQFEVADKAALETAQKQSVNPEYWNDWPGQMARIVPLRRLRNWLDLDPVANAVFARSLSREGGSRLATGDFAVEADRRSFEESAEAAAAGQTGELARRLGAGDDPSPLDRRVEFGTHRGRTWRDLIDDEKTFGYVKHWFLRRSDPTKYKGVTRKLVEAITQAVAEKTQLREAHAAAVESLDRLEDMEHGLPDGHIPNTRAALDRAFGDGDLSAIIEMSDVIAEKATAVEAGS